MNYPMPRSIAPHAPPLRVVSVDVTTIKLRNRRLRKHPQWQIDKIIASIRLYGFNAPILVDEQGFIVSGEGRYQAALALGLTVIPVIPITHLTPSQIKQFRIADNKVAEGAEWNFPDLKLEFEEFRLEDPYFNFEDVGFSTAEADQVLNGGLGDEADPADEQDVAPEKLAISRLGDLWQVGRHRIYCGDAESSSSYVALMGDEIADLIASDPPYGIAVSSLSRLGKKVHREFVQGSDISREEFYAFLKPKVAAMVERAKPGAVTYLFMDWRNVETLLAVGREAGLSLLNLVVWNKMAGGMGSMYRSAHELLPVFMKPGASHANNVQLGRFGRNRKNVIDEPGYNSFSKERLKRLSEHPTVKPVNLIAGLLLDASHRNETVLDPFAGSGTILIAAEKTGRIARAMELDPLYVDVALRRFEERFGVEAIHVESGLSFTTLAARRAGDEHRNVTTPSAASLPRRRRQPPNAVGGVS
jgi:DNA modification methylase